MHEKSKRTICLLFGGRSTEHEVSLRSAKSIYEALPKDEYDVILVGVDQAGRWLFQEKAEQLLSAENVSQGGGTEVTAVAARGTVSLVRTDGGHPAAAIDVVFPIIHGTGGEDGSLQGFLELLDVPYVGSGVLGSAIGMDKDVTKRLVMAAGIAVARYTTLRRTDAWRGELTAIAATLGFPLFVKPASLGSSVGVSKAQNVTDLETAIETAFVYDTKVLVEEFIAGREIEVAVLGNEQPRASVPGEVLPQHEFYSYEAKYLDENGARLDMPARLTAHEIEMVQALACQAFQVLELGGMARVDFFFTADGRWIVNEVNTIPGFTSISMYPKLWELSGLPLNELVARLIDLALERKERERQLQRRFTPSPHS